MLTIQLPDNSAIKTSRTIRSIRSTIEVLTNTVHQRLTQNFSEPLHYEDQSLLKAFLYLQNILEEEEQKLDQLENEIQRKLNQQEKEEEILQTAIYPSEAYHDIINILFNVTNATFKTVNEQTIKHIDSNEILVDEQFIRKFNKIKEAIDCVYGYLSSFASGIQHLLESADEEQQQGAEQYLKAIHKIEKKLRNNAASLDDKLGKEEQQQQLIKQANHFLKEPEKTEHRKKIEKAEAKQAKKALKKEKKEQTVEEQKQQKKLKNKKTESSIKRSDTQENKKAELEKNSDEEQQIKQDKIKKEIKEQRDKRAESHRKEEESRVQAEFLEEFTKQQQESNLKALIEGRKKFKAAVERILPYLLNIIQNHNEFSDQTYQSIKNASSKFLNENPKLNPFGYKYRLTDFMRLIVKAYYNPALSHNDATEYDSNETVDVAKLNIQLRDLRKDRGSIRLQSLQSVALKQTHLDKVIRYQALTLKEMLRESPINNTITIENNTNVDYSIIGTSSNSNDSGNVSFNDDESSELSSTTTSSDENNSPELSFSEPLEFSNDESSELEINTAKPPQDNDDQGLEDETNLEQKQTENNSSNGNALSELNLNAFTVLETNTSIAPEDNKDQRLEDETNLEQKQVDLTPENTKNPIVEDILKLNLNCSLFSKPVVAKKETAEQEDQLINIIKEFQKIHSNSQKRFGGFLRHNIEFTSDQLNHLKKLKKDAYEECIRRINQGKSIWTLQEEYSKEKTGCDISLKEVINFNTTTFLFMVQGCTQTRLKLNKQSRELSDIDDLRHHEIKPSPKNKSVNTQSKVDETESVKSFV